MMQSLNMCSDYDYVNSLIFVIILAKLEMKMLSYFCLYRTFFQVSYRFSSWYSCSLK